METYVVGLDVHKSRTTFVVAQQRGPRVARGEFATTREGVAQWARTQALPRGTRIALETGTLAFFVADELTRWELAPVVIDAHEVRRLATRPRQKSDRRDAAELCEGLRRDLYRTRVHIPTPALRTLRGLLARRRHFVRLQTAESNAVKHLFRARGEAARARSLRTPVGWTRLAAAVATDAALASAVEAHHRVWTAAQTERRGVETQLARHAAPLAAPLARLQTVPGVGPIVALTTLAVFADVTRFPGAKQAASYAGLVPATYQSGACDRHGHITKQGSPELRAMLIEAAHHAARRGHPLHPVFTKLCARHGYRSALVAVAHRLCRILFALLRDQTEFTAGPPRPRRGPGLAEGGAVA